jgi:hypothetical protein
MPIKHNLGVFSPFLYPLPKANKTVLPSGEKAGKLLK